MGSYSFTSHVFILMIFCHAALFCPGLEFAHLFSPTILFLFNDLTCGTNAKQQDRRSWVWVFYFPKCKWLRVCVWCVWLCGRAVQSWLDPHLFDGSVIFELALHLCFIYWTFFSAQARKHTGTVSVFLDFTFFFVISSLPFFLSEVVSTAVTGYSVYITAASLWSIHSCTYRGQNISRFR